MDVVHDRAILLEKHSFGESDQVVTLFTQTHGKIKCVAKGARRSKKRFGPSLETGRLLKVLYRWKEGRDLGFLTEAQSILPNPAWRKEWHTITITSFLLEVVRKTLPEHQPNPEKFMAVAGMLENLSKENALSLLIRFQLQWLSLSGWEAGLGCCHVCGKRWRPQKEVLERQHVLDHHWGHILSRPLKSRPLLEEALLV